MLQALISEKGWTERELARRSGVHPSSIQDYIDGITLPNKENRERLASVLNMSIDELDTELEMVVAKPKRTVDELCRDIRLLSAEDFAIVMEVVFERVRREFKHWLETRPARNRSR